MSDKIKSHHLGRKAILYVRQSSAHQVMHNQESRILQYAMRDRLCELGWREIEIIDDDLGRSAAGAVARAAACEFLSAASTVGADHGRLEPRGSCKHVSAAGASVARPRDASRSAAHRAHL